MQTRDMPKHARVLATIRYLCHAGLRSEVVIPPLIEQLSRVVRFGTWAFAWADSKGQLVNSAYSPLRAESIDYLAKHFDKLVRDCGFSPMDAVRSFPAVSNPRRTGRLNPKLHETESYQKVWGPEGCHFSVVIVVRDANETPLGFVQIFRPQTDIDFSPTDEATLHDVLPYLRQLLKTDAARAAAGPSAQDGPAGVALFVGEGAPEFVSDRALALAVMAFNRQIAVKETGVEVTDPIKGLCQMYGEIRQAEAIGGSSTSVIRTLNNERGSFLFEWETSVRRGRPMWSLVLRHKIPARLQLGALPSGAQLSERQLQVCRGLVDGEPLSVIAERIGIKPATLKDYTREIYRKLDVTDRQSLLRKLVGLPKVESCQPP